MKVLVYAFGPFGKCEENISEIVLKEVRTPPPGIVKRVFPVEFNKKTFLNEIRRTNPDIIIGLAQNSRGMKFRIERKAMNIKKDLGNDRISRIGKGPEKRFVNLKLKKNDMSRISYDAGTFVCNFSMYVISEYVKGKDIKFAFIHIPLKQSPKMAARFVDYKINEALSS